MHTHIEREGEAYAGCVYASTRLRKFENIFGKKVKKFGNTKKKPPYERMHFKQYVCSVICRISGFVLSPHIDVFKLPMISLLPGWAHNVIVFLWKAWALLTHKTALPLLTFSFALPFFLMSSSLATHCTRLSFSHHISASFTHLSAFRFLHIFSFSISSLSLRTLSALHSHNSLPSPFCSPLVSFFLILFD